MPKAHQQASASYRFDPIARPGDSERLTRPTVTENEASHQEPVQESARGRDPDRGELYIMKRPQVVRISSDEGQIISDFEEISGSDGEDSVSSEVESQVAKESEETRELRSFSDAYLLRVSLMTAGPPRITRILRVPSHLTFHQFHGVIQEAFDWDNCHAYRFNVHELGEQPYSGEALDMPMPFKRDGEPLSGSERRKLRDVFGKAGEAMTATYTFDFGDNWTHYIHLLGLADRSLASGMGLDQEIFCLGGEGSPAVGDCGGAGGWENLKKLFKKPDSPDPEKRKTWFRKVSGRRTLDPYKWEMDEVNKFLKVLCRKGYDLNAARGLT